CECSRLCAVYRLVCISSDVSHVFFFFFQAEDGIRDRNVTGVQTCALPILSGGYWKVTRNGKVHGVHRLLWEEAYGPIPDGYVIRSEERRVGKECRSWWWGKE